MPEPDVEVVSLSTGLFSAYQSFARRAFGATAYQASRRYLRWLYEDAPHARVGLGDARVAVADGTVVGCFHKMLLPWRIAGNVELVCSPHNLFVDEAHRTGTGFVLISETLRNERHAWLVGAGEAVHRIYTRMGATAVSTHWTRGVLNPVTAPFAFALVRLRPRALDALLRDIVKRHVTISLPRGHLDVRGTVDDGLVSDVVATLRTGDAALTSVEWTPELVRWRFFSEDGPRHVLVRLHTRGLAEPSLAILSIGVHRSLLVCRVVAWRAHDTMSGAFARLLHRLLTVLGVNVWMGMTASADTSRAWRRGGLQPVPSAPAVMELHRPRCPPWVDPRVEGAASDYGFEAIGLDIN